MRRVEKYMKPKKCFLVFFFLLNSIVKKDTKED